MDSKVMTRIKSDGEISYRIMSPGGYCLRQVVDHARMRGERPSLWEIDRAFELSKPPAVVCAWCGRTKIVGRWTKTPVPADRILSHGMCRECREKECQKKEFDVAHESRR